MKNKMIIFTTMILALALIGPVSAELVLDSVQFNPAIVAAGDNVDIVAQFHYEYANDNDKIGNPEYTFGVELKSDSSIVDSYITILDSKGDGYKRAIYGGKYGTNYNQVFRVKVSSAAPTGDYEFKLIGQWYKNNFATGSQKEIKFNLPVKKEGISLDIAALKTTPSEVRPGDDFVKIKTMIENSAQKDATAVTVSLILPEGFSPSYSDNNKVWAGSVKSKESKEVEFNIDLDEGVKGGVYIFKYLFEYKDDNNNVYTKERTSQFYVKPKPQIEVINVVGKSNTGSTTKMYVTVKNTGEVTAEAVDVRVLKQSSQPFELDVRSDYIGELEPNETGVAIFEIKTTSSAEVKIHDLKLIIRAKGDSDSGDNNIYTFSRHAKFEVTKGWFNPLVAIGLLGFIGVLFYFKKEKFIKIKTGKKKKWTE